jgi:hypothetical protein
LKNNLNLIKHSNLIDSGRFKKIYNSVMKHVDEEKVEVVYNIII